jgi:hypothetical protein
MQLGGAIDTYAVTAYVLSLNGIVPTRRVKSANPVRYFGTQECLRLAQSGLSETSARLSAFGGRADMPRQPVVDRPVQAFTQLIVNRSSRACIGQAERTFQFT